MADFQYKAKDGPDRIVEGLIDAPSEAVAIERISNLGLVPIHVRPSSQETAPAPASTSFGWNASRNKRLIFFSRHLASLVRAGVPVLSAVQILANNEKDKKFQTALMSMLKQIREGRALSQVMQSQSEFFPYLYCAVVRAGESSGGLEEALERMANYLRNQDKLRSKIQKAMVYPTVLLVAGLGTVFFVITFVIPRLSAIFADMGQQLPLSTRIVMAAAAFMSHFWWLVLAIAAFVIIGIPRILKLLLGSRYWDEWKLQMPFVKHFVFKSEFTKFSRTLEMCLSNGLPFLNALQNAIPTVQNAVIRQSLQGAESRIEKGGRLAQSLSESGYFPEFVLNLIAVGEESGKLEEVLNEISESYEEDLDESVQILSTLLEPLMILIIGAIVGFIVIAMLLPVFDINTSF